MMAGACSTSTYRHRGVTVTAPVEAVLSTMPLRELIASFVAGGAGRRP